MVTDNYAKSYVRSPYYNPEEIHITDLVLSANGNGFLYIDPYWIGKDVDQLVLEILPLNDTVIVNQLDKGFPRELHKGTTEMKLSDSKVREFIEYIDTYHRLPIRVNGKIFVLTPTVFSGYEYPKPFLFANFHPAPFTKFIHEEQMPDELAKRMEKRKQMAKERGNSSSNEMLF